MTTATRRPAVAGHFYPGDADHLVAEIERHLAGAGRVDLAAEALVVPHAGYRYSAPVAAAAFACLRPIRERIRRVVVVGPAHRVPLHGMAIPRADTWTTPLGAVPIEAEARRRLAALPRVTVDDAPHEPEHSIEVQLPFLQHELGSFDLVPLLVGRATPDEVADVLEHLLDDGSLLVVSTDLSHYHDYETARRLDSETVRAVERLAVEAIAPDRACGSRPLAGFLTVARRRGLRPVTLDARNSGDTSGDHDRVVGYAAWAFVADPVTPLSPSESVALLGLAGAAIDDGLDGRRPHAGPLDGLPGRLGRPGAAFVTLETDAGLRGCRGGLEATQPVGTAVVQAAWAAAFDDSRFSPLTPDERARVDLSVSVLGALHRLFPDDDDHLLSLLRMGHDGVVLAAGRRRGVFLPDVWDQCVDGPDFLARLRAKAGLAEAFDPSVAVYRFETEKLG